MRSRVVVFIDYQNVVLGAHHRFGSAGTANRIANLDPVKLGQLLVSRQNSEGTLSEVRVYRGLPSSAREPLAFSANDRQTDAWSRTAAITTIRRPILYPRGWPDVPAREKGIDVSLAIDTLRLALERKYDAGILFSSDTDLVPALETLAELNLARFEVAAWAGTPRLRLPGTGRPWCHFLSRVDYAAVIDPVDYTKPPTRPAGADQRASGR